MRRIQHLQESLLVAEQRAVMSEAEASTRAAQANEIVPKVSVPVCVCVCVCVYIYIYIYIAVCICHSSRGCMCD
jgi:hypothetical protein